MRSRAKEKIVQFLEEAIESEHSWSHTVTAHITMTPAGSYRDVLERQLRETDRHARRFERRVKDLDGHRSWVSSGIGVVSGLIDQAMSAGRAPRELVQGGRNLIGGAGGEEKMLRNAVQEAAWLEGAVFSYRALERVARATEDTTTAELASSAGDDKRRGLRSLEGLLDEMVEAVIRSEIRGKGTHGRSTNGAEQAAQGPAGDAQKTAEHIGDRVRARAEDAGKILGVTRGEGEVRGALVHAEDLDIADYDQLSAVEIVRQLRPLSQIDLAKIAAYERKNDNRSTITDRISTLSEHEPWPGYDDQRVVEVRKHLQAGDDQLVRQVNTYERRHKGRRGVLEATELAHS